MKKTTYKAAGVDISKADSFKVKIRSLVRSSQGAQVLKGVGGFGGLFDFAEKSYKDPVLVSSADGVGTKLKIAILNSKHDTVGIDCVGMNTNDILCVGARPLFFLDYIAYSKLKEDVLLDIIKGINTGCLQSECALIGGETAQMPGMYKNGEYDLAGFCVGVIGKDKIIDGSSIQPTDVVIGLESNGIHSNGYSLVRKVLSEKELKRMKDELLKPTRIYVSQVLPLLEEFNRTDRVIRGISHITGGAFYDKIARILPEGVCVRIRKSSWQIPKIFDLIRIKGNVPDKEMYHTFNMGIGMVLIVKSGFAGQIIQMLNSMKLKSWIIGDVIQGKKEVQII